MLRYWLLVTCLLGFNFVACLDVFGRGSSNLFNKDPKKNWVVLVAGSNGWINYRHQADVFHAYQVMRQHNIPAENIITFAYDDIANHRENPFPGKVFNDYSHKDVYKGVVIDYRQEEVTPENFMRVLKGDKGLQENGKKVLRSGPEDHVFIYFSDHGSESLIAFPSSVLYARQLNETLSYMHNNKMYSKMVLYVEACESGSMFYDILPSNIGIYVTTAANRFESSWAAYCADKQIHNCLSDEYSHNWLADSEHHDLGHYTLDQQFDTVKTETRGSHVMKFGEMDMGKLNVGEFQGHSKKAMRMTAATLPKAVDKRLAPKAHLAAMSRRLMEATTEEEHEAASRKLHRALQLGHIVKHTFDDIILDVTTRSQPTLHGLSKLEQLKCYEAVFNQFQTHCFTIQQVPEVAGYTTQLMQLCKVGYEAETLIQSVHHVCS